MIVRMFSYFFFDIDYQYGSADRFEESRDGIHRKFYSESFRHMIRCVDHVQ